MYIYIFLQAVFFSWGVEMVCKLIIMQVLRLQSFKFNNFLIKFTWHLWYTNLLAAVFFLCIYYMEIKKFLYGVARGNIWDNFISLSSEVKYVWHL